MCFSAYVLFPFSFLFFFVALPPFLLLYSCATFLRPCTSLIVWLCYAYHFSMCECLPHKSCLICFFFFVVFLNMSPPSLITFKQSSLSSSSTISYSLQCSSSGSPVIFLPSQHPPMSFFCAQMEKLLCARRVCLNIFHLNPCSCSIG